MMRGTNSGGKVKTKRKPTTTKSKRSKSPTVRPTATERMKNKISKHVNIIRSVDTASLATGGQYVFTFSTFSPQQLDKLPKKVPNRDFVQIIASEQIAISFITKWATSRDIQTIYLVSVDTDRGD